MMRTNFCSRAYCQQMHPILVLVAALSVTCQAQTQAATVQSGSGQGSHAEESVADLRQLIHEAQAALNALQLGIAKHSSLLDGLMAPAQHDPGKIHGSPDCNQLLTVHDIGNSPLGCRGAPCA